jgi:hypothetical protein
MASTALVPLLISTLFLGFGGCEGLIKVYCPDLNAITQVVEEGDVDQANILRQSYHASKESFNL